MLSKNSTITKVSLVGAGNIFNAIMGFAFLAVVARDLELDSFGRYAVLTGILLLVSRVLDFGTNSIFVSESIKSQDDSEIGIFYAQKVLLFLVTVPLAIVLLSLFKLLSLQILLIFSVGLLSYGLNFSLYAIFQREQSFVKLVAANTVPAIIKLTFAVLIFFSVLKVNLSGAFLIFCASVLSDLVLLPYLPKKYLSVKISFKNLKPRLIRTFSPGISQVVYESWPTINNGLTKLFHQFSDVGIFTIANKISSMFSLIAFSIFTVILPKNSLRIRQKLWFDFKEAIIFVFGLVSLSICAIIISKVFVTRFFGIKYAASLPLLNLLILSSAFSAAQSILESFFFAESQTGFMIRTSFAKVVVVVLAALILIPKLGLTGLAYSNLFASVVGVIFTYIFIRKVKALS